MPARAISASKLGWYAHSASQAPIGLRPTMRSNPVTPSPSCGRIPFAGREHPWQVTMRRRAREKLDVPCVPVADEARKHVAPVPIPDPAHVGEVVAIEGGNGREARVAVEALHLSLRERLEAAEVLAEASLEELVPHHGRQRRRHAHRQSERHPLVGHPVERVEEGQVALDERLVEPSLFEVTRVLGVPHERKVSVKHQREVAVSHRRARS